MSKTLPLSALVLFAACASWTPVQHAPRPLHEANLSEELMRLVMTARAWRPAKVDVKETFVVLSYVNQYGVQTVTVPFGEVKKLELLTNKGEEWDVDVLDEKGERLYRYLAHDEAKARAFVDVMSALTTPSSPGGPPPPVQQL